MNVFHLRPGGGRCNWPLGRSAGLVSESSTGPDVETDPRCPGWWYNRWEGWGCAVSSGESRILQSGQSSTGVKEVQGADILHAHRNCALTINAQLMEFLLYKYMCVMHRKASLVARW